MREKLLALHALQKVDLEVAGLKKSAETYPKQTAELEQQLGAARAAAESERQKLEDIERQKANLEDTLKDAHHDLFVELGTLRQVCISSKVVQLENIGPALGRRGNDLWRLYLSKIARSQD